MTGARLKVYITAIQQNIDTTTPSTHRTHTTVADGDTRGAQPCEHPRTTHAPTQQTETQVNRKYICAAAPTAVERARSTPLFVPRVAFSAAASRCRGRSRTDHDRRVTALRATRPDDLDLAFRTTYDHLGRRKASSRRHTRHDTDRTVLSCLAGGVN